MVSKKYLFEIHFTCPVDYAWSTHNASVVSFSVCESVAKSESLTRKEHFI